MPQKIKKPIFSFFLAYLFQEVVEISHILFQEIVKNIVQFFVIRTTSSLNP